eukprot:7784601-Pyramimonas_sp.AAC.1
MAARSVDSMTRPCEPIIGWRGPRSMVAVSLPSSIRKAWPTARVSRPACSMRSLRPAPCSSEQP